MDAAVATFLDGIAPPARQAAARDLLGLFRAATGFAPQLWPGGILGFGRYAYTYDSGHSGTSPATGFAARKAELVIYILPGFAAMDPILARLGPHRLGKACLYLRRLDGIDRDALADLIRAGLADLATRWTVTAT